MYISTFECVFRDCMPYLKASLAFFTQKATSFGQEATHKKGDVLKTSSQKQPLIPSNRSSLFFCVARFSNKESIGREFEQKLKAEK